MQIQGQKSLRTLIACSLLLAGCNTFHSTPVTNESLITWVRFDDTNKVDDKCRRLSGTLLTGRRIKGCAQYNLIEHLCTIYSYNPRSLDDEYICTLGHEVKHCFDGAYHN